MSDTPFSYQLGTCRLDSQINMPALAHAPALASFSDSPQAVVQVVIGETPAQIDGSALKRPGFEGEPGRLLIKLPNLMRILISHGNRITVTPFEGCQETDIQAFVLGPAIGAAFLQQGALVMHGAAIQIGECVVVISGDSGWGKSTLAAALMARGHRVLGDEHALIKVENGVPVLQPSVPRLLIGRDVLNYFDLAQPGTTAERDGIDRFSVPLPPWSQRELAGLPLSHLLLLGKGWQRESGVIEDLRGFLAFNAVRESLYRLPYLRGLGIESELFGRLQRVASQVTVSRLLSRRRFEDLNDMVRGIETATEQDASGCSSAEADE